MRIPASVLLRELRERGYTGGYTMDASALWCAPKCQVEMAEGVSKIGQMSRRHGIRQMSFRGLNASTVRSQPTASNPVEVRALPRPRKPYSGLAWRRVQEGSPPSTHHS